MEMEISRLLRHHRNRRPAAVQSTPCSPRSRCCSPSEARGNPLTDLLAARQGARGSRAPGDGGFAQGNGAEGAGARGPASSGAAGDAGAPAAQCPRALHLRGARSPRALGGPASNSKRTRLPCIRSTWPGWRSSGRRRCAGRVAGFGCAPATAAHGTARHGIPPTPPPQTDRGVAVPR
jgi:hypothetical protein